MSEQSKYFIQVEMCSETEAVDEDAMKAFFDKFDTDANGTISFDEWLGDDRCCIGWVPSSSLILAST